MEIYVTAEKARKYTEARIAQKYIDAEDPVWQKFTQDFNAGLEAALRGDGPSDSWVDFNLHPDANGQHYEDIERYLHLKGYRTINLCLGEIRPKEITFRVSWEEDKYR